MYMKVHEFRTNLKQAFDAALHGEKVIVERGGVQYQLIAEGTFPKITDPSEKYTIAEKVEPRVKPDLLKIPGVKKASDILVCTGHDNFRRNCGLKGCQYS